MAKIGNSRYQYFSYFLRAKPPTKITNGTITNKTLWVIAGQIKIGKIDANTSQIKILVLPSKFFHSLYTTSIPATKINPSIFKSEPILLRYSAIRERYTYCS